ncbi:hypothetical protein MJT46_011110 [Ovis ammon polii x Ovis aries]|nr:hypothetical protein MJT46_011110 [Ovis ammon polii x Ovis aries]
MGSEKHYFKPIEENNTCMARGGEISNLKRISQDSEASNAPESLKTTKALEIDAGDGGGDFTRITICVKLVTVEHPVSECRLDFSIAPVMIAPLPLFHSIIITVLTCHCLQCTRNRTILGFRVRSICQSRVEFEDHSLKEQIVPGLKFSTKSFFLKHACDCPEAQEMSPRMSKASSLSRYPPSGEPLTVRGDLSNKILPLKGRRSSSESGGSAKSSKGRYILVSFIKVISSEYSKYLTLLPPKKDNSPVFQNSIVCNQKLQLLIGLTVSFYQAALRFHLVSLNILWLPETNQMVMLKMVALSDNTDEIKDKDIILRHNRESNSFVVFKTCESMSSSNQDDDEDDANDVKEVKHHYGTSDEDKSFWLISKCSVVAEALYSLSHVPFFILKPIRIKAFDRCGAKSDHQFLPQSKHKSGKISKFCKHTSEYKMPRLKFQWIRFSLLYTEDGNLPCRTVVKILEIRILPPYTRFLSSLVGDTVRSNSQCRYDYLLKRNSGPRCRRLLLQDRHSTQELNCVEVLKVTAMDPLCPWTHTKLCVLQMSKVLEIFCSEGMSKFANIMYTVILFEKTGYKQGNKLNTDTIIKCENATKQCGACQSSLQRKLESVTQKEACVVCWSINLIKHRETLRSIHKYPISAAFLTWFCHSSLGTATLLDFSLDVPSGLVCHLIQYLSSQRFHTEFWRLTFPRLESLFDKDLLALECPGIPVMEFLEHRYTLISVPQCLVV